jgi:GntR family transcriptional regulator
VNEWENFRTEFDDKSPIYSQIITLFSASFVRGEISPGERIPSIRDMALNLRVNANTVQRVYQEMERGGLINSKRGTGYFFTEDKNMINTVSNNMASGAIGRFLRDMRGLGLSDSQILNELKSQMDKEKGEDGNATANNRGH